MKQTGIVSLDSSIRFQSMNAELLVNIEGKIFSKMSYLTVIYDWKCSLVQVEEVLFV